MSSTGDGVYDPRRPNDRLLLGLKGTMSEFELTLLHSCLADAKTAKAKRGAHAGANRLRMAAPRSGRIGPGSARPGPDSTCLSELRRVGERTQGFVLDEKERSRVLRAAAHWRVRRKFTRLLRPTTYRRILSILKNPFHAGVYAFGKRETKVTVSDGRAHKTLKTARPGRIGPGESRAITPPTSMRHSSSATASGLPQTNLLSRHRTQTQRVVAARLWRGC